jgi:hypothetical protein
MIITLIDKEYNINKENMTVTFSDYGILPEYKYINRYRTYKVNINNSDYDLKCPEISTGSNEKKVIWPSFKLPYRKYPVYVYFYAAALYLSTNKSMRETAAKVRKKFGLEKFSHSTLSRCIKKLALNLDILIEILSENFNDTVIIKRKRWSDEKLKQFSKLLNILSPILDKNKTIKYGSTLNFEFFNKTEKFPV